MNDFILFLILFCVIPGIIAFLIVYWFILQAAKVSKNFAIPVRIIEKEAKTKNEKRKNN